MRYFKLMKSYPFQVFRHRVYLPLLNLLGILGDLRRGVTTSKIIELNELGLNPDVGVRCETVSYRKLHQAFKVAKSYGFNKFCDIGCGLGRAVLVADEVGFNELYAVDISPELISMAKDNLKKRKVSAVLSCSDVNDFLIPGGRLVVYLFNPFGKERMTLLIEKLKKRQSETLVVYHNPKFHSCFKPSHKVRSITWQHFGLYNETVHFYLIPANLPT